MAAHTLQIAIHQVRARRQELCQGLPITGALCITVSAPIRDKNEEIVGFFGVGIRFENPVRAEE